MYEQPLSGALTRADRRGAALALDGSAIYYRIDDRLMAVRVQRGGTFVAGKPMQLLGGLYDLQSGTGLSYAVDPLGAVPYDPDRRRSGRRPGGSDADRAQLGGAPGK